MELSRCRKLDAINKNKKCSGRCQSFTEWKIITLYRDVIKSEQAHDVIWEQQFLTKEPDTSSWVVNGMQTFLCWNRTRFSIARLFRHILVTSQTEFLHCIARGRGELLGQSILGNLWVTSPETWRKFVEESLKAFCVSSSPFSSLGRVTKPFWPLPQRFLKWKFSRFPLFAGTHTDTSVCRTRIFLDSELCACCRVVQHPHIT